MTASWTTSAPADRMAWERESLVRVFRERYSFANVVRLYARLFQLEPAPLLSALGTVVVVAMGLAYVAQASLGLTGLGAILASLAVGFLGALLLAWYVQRLAVALYRQVKGKPASDGHGWRSILTAAAVTTPALAAWDVAYSTLGTALGRVGSLLGLIVVYAINASMVGIVAVMTLEPGRPRTLRTALSFVLDQFRRVLLFALVAAACVVPLLLLAGVIARAIVGPAADLTFVIRGLGTISRAIFLPLVLLLYVKVTFFADPP